MLLPLNRNSNIGTHERTARTSCACTLVGQICRVITLCIDAIGIQSNDMLRTGVYAQAAPFAVLFIYNDSRHATLPSYTPIRHPNGANAVIQLVRL